MSDRIASQSLPASWPGRVAFEVATQAVTFAEVVCAAAVRCDLQPCLAATRQALAAEDTAARRGWEPDLGAVETAMNEFRYARGLVTAEETEQWLSDHGLGRDDLGDHFVRRFWKGHPDCADDSTTVDDAGIAAAWAADLVLSGTFSRLARQQARELLAAGAVPPDPADAAGLREALRLRLGLDPSEFGQWIRNWALEAAVLDRLLIGQHRYATAKGELLSPGRRAAALAELRHSLMRVEILVSEFDSATAAREAHLCVTADGMTLESVAAEAGYPVRTESGTIQRYPEAWRRLLAGSPPGYHLPPLAMDGVHWVCRILRQEEPNLSDPEVAAAVDTAILERHFARREMSEIRWRFPQEGMS